MHDDDLPARRARSIFLSVLLTVLFGGIVFFFSVLLCGGLSIGMLAVIGGLVVLGYFHYLVWGRALAHEVSEQADDELREGELEDLDWHWEEPQRFGRL